jgi:hypothetical protein
VYQRACCPSEGAFSEGSLEKSIVPYELLLCLLWGKIVLGYFRYPQIQ